MHGGCWLVSSQLSFFSLNTCQEPMPSSTAIHNRWYLPTSINSEDTLPDMYIDQCIRDNSLLRFSSSC